MDISVVLATYNRASSLRVTLESLSKLVVPPTLHWQLLVVDNNSSDETPTVVREFAKKNSFMVRYIFEGRQGRSVALNAGVQEATGDIIAITDDDVTLDQDWLLSIKSMFDQFDCAAVAGRIVPVWNQRPPAWYEMEEQLQRFIVGQFDAGNEIQRIQVPPMGANSAFRRSAFHKHGLFRLDLGVRGEDRSITCDDSEFGWRLLRAGETIMYCPAMVVYHPVDPRRLNRSYFLTWFYNNGRSLTRAWGLPDLGVSYFGVPRWLFREFGTNLARWLCCFDGNYRFHHKLRTYRSLGHIVESRRLSSAKDVAQEQQQLQVR
jgi:glycosyltransferase involved in cell wall biosynthesis